MPKRGFARAAAACVLAAVLFITAPFTAWAAGSITLTFVRHGESQANADGAIDTRVSGPDLTAIGRQKALDVADALTTTGTPYDGIYVSTMIRTRQTADPFVTATGLPVDVLPGLREINAGSYEGAPQNSGLQRILYAFPRSPGRWGCASCRSPAPPITTAASSRRGPTPPSRRSMTAATSTRWRSRTA
ncbi:histidine phosphatase family protein [Mycobacterium sp. URHB0021]